MHFLLKEIGLFCKAIKIRDYELRSTKLDPQFLLLEK